MLPFEHVERKGLRINITQMGIILSTERDKKARKDIVMKVKFEQGNHDLEHLGSILVESSLQFLFNRF